MVVGLTHLSCLMSLDTELDQNSGLPTNRLSPTAKSWFRAARFDVGTIEDVLSELDNGLNHVIQVLRR